ELPAGDGKTIDIVADEEIENMLENKIGRRDDVDAREDGNLSLIVRLAAFEDVILLSHYLKQDESVDMESGLYVYDDHYYIYLEFCYDDVDNGIQEDMISQVFEFADDTDVTIHVLEEYGKQIFAEDTFAQIRAYFPA